MAPQTLFLAQILLLTLVGRLLGEGMLRLGQPAVMGQLLSGILLGPTVLGAIWPELHHAVFPTSPAQQDMLRAVAQLGVLLLLLLIGMRTDLSVIGRVRRAAVAVSIAGTAVPFLAGFGLAQLLPDSLLPQPGRRMIAGLLLGTALSVSSVQIAATAIRELNVMRRTLGQVMVAAAVIDDMLAWIALAVILGLARHGRIDAGSLTRSLVGTALFLLVSFTLGRRAVFLLIRSVNDNFASEMQVITAIIAVTGGMALITAAMGVHTVLGAFVAGVLVGQSPMLTRHIDEQLRGLIFALFMPVFFSFAGLSADLSALWHPPSALLLLALVAVASIGKFSGAYLGAVIGGLSRREALALGCGMNARGSTEIIVASIGLETGALGRPLYTMIIAMATITTIAMPPLLRWATRRLPLSADERARIEREDFEARGFVPNLERLLVAVDQSASGRFASHLAGLLAATRRLPATILQVEGDASRHGGSTPERPSGVGEVAKAAAKAVIAEGAAPAGVGQPAAEISTRVRDAEPAEQAITQEGQKGYDLLLIGVEPVTRGADFGQTVSRIVRDFDGAVAIIEARGIHRESPTAGALNILVPVTGSLRSRRGAEVAVALARAGNGSVTALYVAPTQLRAQRLRQLGEAWVGATDEQALLKEIVRLGDQESVPVRTTVRRHIVAEEAILHQLVVGGHDLIVMGVSPRAGSTLSFGDVPAAILDRSGQSLLFVSG